MYRIFRSAVVALGAVVMIGSCASNQVEMAFQGALDQEKETRVIADYCRSCHTHKEFNPHRHLADAVAAYSEEPYRSATDCRTCHGVTKDFWRDFGRVTYHPGGEAR